MTLKDFIYGYYYQSWKPVRKPRYVSLELFASWLTWNAIGLILNLISLIVGVKNLGWMWFYAVDFTPILLGLGLVSMVYFDIIKEKKINSMGDRYDTPEYARMHDVVTWIIIILSVINFAGALFCLYLTDKYHNSEGFPDSIIFDNLSRFFDKFAF